MRGKERRAAALLRESRETRILLALDLEGGETRIDTGLGFLDHLLSSLALHAGWGLELLCEGDLEVDSHHSAEDCGIALGEALKAALALGRGLGLEPRRFASAYAPLDEALARAVVDLSGRPWAAVDLGLDGARLGALEGENAGHLVASLALTAGICVHLEVLAGTNAHHRAEAAFKALALALREALEPRPRRADLPQAGTAGAAGATGPAGASGPSAKGQVRLEAIGAGDFAARREAFRGR